MAVSLLWLSFAAANREADERHFVQPHHKSASLDYPASKESALMLSACRPENDGYFGGTFGDPVVLQYAFEMESYVNAEITEALNAVREHVMDVTVASTFPAVCSYRELNVGTNELKGVTGFQFGQDLDSIRT
jgi:hypothetical protein